MVRRGEVHVLLLPWLPSAFFVERQASSDQPDGCYNHKHPPTNTQATSI
jgi:hypothetical protein